VTERSSEILAPPTTADFIAKNLIKIPLMNSLQNKFDPITTADFIEKNFSVMTSLKKISTADFIEKQIRPPNLTPLLISLQKN